MLTSENRVYVYGEALYRVIKVDYDTIDCGENTELFKALAAMNDENDREQWFTDGYHFELCPTNKADMVAWHMMYRTKPRKATAEEIVEYFKNKER